MIRETRIDALYGIVQLMDQAVAALPDLQPPLLVMYGLKDEVIPMHALCRVLDALPGGTNVYLYPDGYHMLLRDLQAHNVWEDLLRWLDHQPPRHALQDRSRCADQNLVH
jgi:esterase/lipase